MPDKIVEEEIDWNECLPFTGPEAALPTGLAHLPKGIEVLDMLLPDSIKRTRSVGVLSVQIDERCLQGAGRDLWLWPDLDSQCQRRTHDSRAMV
jgi:hypothetical protein